MIKVDYIGFVTPQIMQWYKLNLDYKINGRDINQSAEHYVTIYYLGYVTQPTRYN